MKWNSSLAIATLAISIIPVIFYKRIPGLRNFRSKYARVLWSLAFIFLPASIANIFQQKSITDFITRRWYLRADDFITYKLSGDVLRINEEVRLVDF